MSPTTLTPTDFDYLCAVVRSDSSIVLEAGKEYLFESRLHPIAHRHGLRGLGELVARLRSGEPELRSEVVDAMTTNETSFFRDGHPWDGLRDRIIPDLVAARPGQQLTIWCAACSSGQEPYSLAMLLRERFPGLCESGLVRIVATDLSPTMLDRARLGRYTPLEVDRGVPALSRARWFRRDGGSWIVHDDIRGMVELRLLNLADRPGWATLPPAFDLVLLRNVLIYFDAATKVDVLARVYERLRPTGMLLLGASETALDVAHPFERTTVGGTAVYRPGTRSTR